MLLSLKYDGESLTCITNLPSIWRQMWTQYRTPWFTLSHQPWSFKFVQKYSRAWGRHSQGCVDLCCWLSAVVVVSQSWWGEDHAMNSSIASIHAYIATLYMGLLSQHQGGERSQCLTFTWQGAMFIWVVESLLYHRAPLVDIACRSAHKQDLWLFLLC